MRKITVVNQENRTKKIELPSPLAMAPLLTQTPYQILQYPQSGETAECRDHRKFALAWKLQVASFGTKEKFYAHSRSLTDAFTILLVADVWAVKKQIKSIQVRLESEKKGQP